MHARRTQIITLGFLGLLAIAATLVLAQGRRGGQTRTDTSPIDLPGGSRIEFLNMKSPALNGEGQFSIFFPPSYAKG